MKARLNFEKPSAVGNFFVGLLLWMIGILSAACLVVNLAFATCTLYRLCTSPAPGNATPRYMVVVGNGSEKTTYYTSTYQLTPAGAIQFSTYDEATGKMKSVLISDSFRVEEVKTK